MTEEYGTGEALAFGAGPHLGMAAVVGANVTATHNVGNDAAGPAMTGPGNDFNIA